MKNELKKYLDEINKYPLLLSKEEKELAKRIKEENDDEAKRVLAKGNLRLVVKIAEIYEGRNPKVTLLDLIQEGNLGLFKAVEKYDYRKNYKFSTYAVWWIKEAIENTLRRNKNNH